MLWWWSTTIEADEGKRQLDDFRQQGIGTVIVYPAHGMRPHFLSEEWWELWAIFLDHARRTDVALGMVPDFFHPQGDARDVRMDPPDPSRVLEGHPEYRLQRLQLIERRFSGPGRALIRGLPDSCVIAVAGRVRANGELDAESLQDLSSALEGEDFATELGEGEWLLSFYHPIDYLGPINMRVDPLNPDATRRYIDLTLGELVRRFPDHAGTTFKYALLDSEGSFGGPIAWSPLFFETFHKRCGYDLRPVLPLLMHEGGAVTPKIRNDYFRIVSELFVENYWQLIADWCESHGIETIQQSWGDNLVLESTRAGDFMASQRAMTYPFMEDLFSWHHSPRGFKEVASIAHFEGKPLWVEAQLLEGVESFISPQKMRAGGNVLGAWGVTFQTAMLSYDRYNMLDGNPMWGPEQPHWKFFHQYGDLMQRIGFLNDAGTSVAPILLLKPLAAAVSAPSSAFEGSGEFAGVDAVLVEQDRGSNFVQLVETDYEALMRLLVESQRDFEVADEHYLSRSTIASGELEIAESRFKIVVLPRMSIISRRSMQTIRRFCEGGGAVIAYGVLPRGSSDEGWNDPEIRDHVEAIFGVPPDHGEDAAIEHAGGGRAWFVAGGREKVVRHIEQTLPADFAVVKGPSEHLFYSHRVKEGRDIYWLASDTGHARSIRAAFDALGTPEIWDAESGERREPLYWVEDGRTILHLEFAPWDGFAVVFQHATEDRPIRLEETNLECCSLTVSGDRPRIEGRISTATTAFVRGSWRGKAFNQEKPIEEPPIQELPATGWSFTPSAPRVEIRYAAEMVEAEGRGVAAGFADAAYNHRAWPLTWLSRERLTVRNWWIIGPFRSDNGRGFDTVYPPEQDFDPDRPCRADGGATLLWQYVHGRNPWLNVGEILDYVGQPGVAYAATYVYSPQAQEVQARFELGNGKIWVNGKQVYRFYGQIGFVKMTDGFAERLSVRLDEGWNEILLKIESSFPAFNSQFVFRFTNREGFPAPGLISAERPGDPRELLQRRQRGVPRERMRFLPPFPPAEIREGCFTRPGGRERWYRVDIPPGTTSFVVPEKPQDLRVYVNGNLAEADVGRRRVSFGQLDFERPNCVALCMPADQDLVDYLIFESGTTEYRLGNWTWTGLTHYSGEVVYETEFDLYPGLAGRNVMLDLGSVGLTAEVWLNGELVATRLWAPFELDVSAQIRPGTNRLRIAVTNSDANRRAEASVERMVEGRFDLWHYGWRGWYAPPYMGAIDLNGLVGPVRLVPYHRVSMEIDAD